MSSITIFSEVFCHGGDVANKVAESLGSELIFDRALISQTSERAQMSESKIHRALFEKPSVFNKFTLENERAIANLKLLLAEILKGDNLLFSGFAGHLIPQNITHVLRVGIIAETKYRVERLMQEQGLSEKDAIKVIRKEDEKAALWTSYLFQKAPWDAKLYDIVIPMGKKSVEEAVTLICEYVQKDILKVTPVSQKAVEDFALAAKVETVLGKEGHDVSVSAGEGLVTLTINKHVLRLSRLEEELKKITMTVSGVKDVETKVGPGFYKSDIYGKFDIETPSKVVLVDDEREFVQTLSDRLLMRDMGTAVAYDGEQALSLVEEDEPEVMVLDLKMPGIDGIEVLRRVRREHPNMEVIILTGHGSKEDEEICLKLGAFAYLEKPIDMEVLAQTMCEAYQRVRERRSDVSDKQD